MNVRELYDSRIKSLPASDRLQLATLILNDIPPQSVADYRDDWSEQDLLDFASASWGRAGDVKTDAEQRNG